MNYVDYRDHGEFEVVDANCLRELSGGFYVQFGKGNKVNNGCVEDRNNTGCVSPNGLCASDTVCAEVI